MRTYLHLLIHSAMQRKKKNHSDIVSTLGALALSAVLVLSGCANEQGESHKALGTGDGDKLEESGYENTEGHDSTNSGAAVTSAVRADTAADEEGLVEEEVTEKLDTSETYSSVNGRSSTSNVGSSVSVSKNKASDRLNNPTQVNQTPTQGDQTTTTNKEVPLGTTSPSQGNSGTPKTNEAGETNPNGQGGTNNVERPQTGLEDPNGRPLKNGQAQSADESKNKQNVSSDKTLPKKN